MNYNDKCKQAANVNYSFDYSESTPISSWGYVGYSVLWSIPMLGWLIWFFSCFSKKNRNVRNYARSYVCTFLLAIIVMVVTVILVFVAMMLGFLTADTFEEIITQTQPVA